MSIQLRLFVKRRVLRKLKKLTFYFKAELSYLVSLPIVLYLFDLSYCFYKTIVKKEALTKGELAAAIILLFLVWVYPILILYITSF